MEQLTTHLKLEAEASYVVVCFVVFVVVAFVFVAAVEVVAAAAAVVLVVTGSNVSELSQIILE